MLKVLLLIVICCISNVSSPDNGHRWSSKYWDINILICDLKFKNCLTKNCFLNFFSDRKTVILESKNSTKIVKINNNLKFVSIYFINHMIHQNVIKLQNLKKYLGNWKLIYPNFSWGFLYMSSLRILYFNIGIIRKK